MNEEEFAEICKVRRAGSSRGRWQRGREVGGDREMGRKVGERVGRRGWTTEEEGAERRRRRSCASSPQAMEDDQADIYRACYSHFLEYFKKVDEEGKGMLIGDTFKTVLLPSLVLPPPPASALPSSPAL
eukprot:748689-Hanusia_phi.AAC.1